PAQAAGERLLGSPAKLAFDLARINPVAPVMTRPVCHERNLLSIGLAVVARLTLVQKVAELMHDFKIRPLAGCTDIVDLAWRAPLQDAPDCGTMIRDIKPVANILSVAIDRQRLPSESAVNDKGDQLFGELIGAIIVRAIGGEDRQAIRAVIGAHQMIR